MREIVTLQFGQQSNYVGTHFWNTQVCHLLPRYFKLLLACLFSLYEPSEMIEHLSLLLCRVGMPRMHT